MYALYSSQTAIIVLKFILDAAIFPHFLVLGKI